MNKIYNINLFVNIIYMAQPTKPNPDFSYILAQMFQ